MTLDRSHHRCPTRQEWHRRSTRPTWPGHKDLCFRTCPRRGAVRLPVTGPHLAPPLRKAGGATRLDRPASLGRFGMLSQAGRGGAGGAGAPLPGRWGMAAAGGGPDPEGRTHSLFTMSNNKPDAERRLCANLDEPGGEFLVCGRPRKARARVRSAIPFRHRRGDGGARRDRTDGLMLAKHALYRLSYCPERLMARSRAARPDAGSHHGLP